MEAGRLRRTRPAGRGRVASSPVEGPWRDCRGSSDGDVALEVPSAWTTSSGADAERLGDVNRGAPGRRAGHFVDALGTRSPRSTSGRSPTPSACERSEACRATSNQSGLGRLQGLVKRPSAPERIDALLEQGPQKPGDLQDRPRVRPGTAGRQRRALKSAASLTFWKETAPPWTWPTIAKNMEILVAFTLTFRREPEDPEDQRPLQTPKQLPRPSWPTKAISSESGGRGAPGETLHRRPGPRRSQAEPTVGQFFLPSPIGCTSPSRRLEAYPERPGGVQPASSISFPSRVSPPRTAPGREPRPTIRSGDTARGHGALAGPTGRHLHRS